MALRTTKKLLLSLIVVGVLASFTVPKTYALLTGESRNTGSTIATGTVTLSDTVSPSVTACLSQSGASNANANCDVLLNASSLWYPISSSSPGPSEYSLTEITLQNTGSLPGNLSVYMPSCNQGTTTGAPTNSSPINPCCPGNTNPCGTGSLDFYIQETDASWNATNGQCWWPVVQAGACPFTDDSLGSFESTYPQSSGAWKIGSMAAQASRYFEIGLAEPVDAANGLQGQTANLALTWHLGQ
jgi:hypothetical protein